MNTLRTPAVGMLTVVLAMLISCAPATNDNRGPVNVQVEPAKQASSIDGFAYNGTIEESEKIPMNFMVMGTVARVFVAEGDPVRKGEVLATLVHENYTSAYTLALASQKQAEDAFARLEPIYKNGNLPEVKLVEAETNLQKAKSQAAIARKNLDDCSLIAPDDGVVGRRMIEPGMNVLPNATSIEIIKVKNVFAVLAVPENEIRFIRKGITGTVVVGALGGESFAGTVEQVGVQADPLAHTYKVKLAVNNSAGKLNAGMICTVSLSAGTGTARLSVPSRAILVDELGKTVVFVIHPSTSRAYRRAVTTGALLQEGTEITSGLGVGELVVVAGQHKLSDDAPVNVVSH